MGQASDLVEVVVAVRDEPRNLVGVGDRGQLEHRRCIEPFVRGDPLHPVTEFGDCERLVEAGGKGEGIVGGRSGAKGVVDLVAIGQGAERAERTAKGGWRGGSRRLYDDSSIRLVCRRAAMPLIMGIEGSSEQEFCRGLVGRGARERWRRLRGNRHGGCCCPFALRPLQLVVASDRAVGSRVPNRFERGDTRLDSRARCAGGVARSPHSAVELAVRRGARRLFLERLERGGGLVQSLAQSHRAALGALKRDDIVLRPLVEVGRAQKRVLVHRERFGCRPRLRTQTLGVSFNAFERLTLCCDCGKKRVALRLPLGLRGVNCGVSGRHPLCEVFEAGLSRCVDDDGARRRCG